MERLNSVMRTEDLTKTYGKSRGIKNVDLTVNEGEVFGFLGPNGAGKTTMIRTLLGFMQPTDGKGEIFGHDVQRDSVAVRSMVGNLPGEFALEDRMNGEKLLKLFARLRGVQSLDYAYELADRINADLKRPMRRLSRGNKQKIGLIQAMFHRPPLLILDEPTGGLDPLVQEEFLKILAEVKEEGRTVFFSSHTLSEVERVCDRVGIIREGELVRVETTDTLINKSFRHVMLQFAESLDVEDTRRFESLEGIENFRYEGSQLYFELHGNLDSVVKLAARHEVLDMIYERPSLEEIFLAYYGGGATSDGGGDQIGDGAGTRKVSSNSVPNASSSGNRRENGGGDDRTPQTGNESAAGSREDNPSYRAKLDGSQNGNPSRKTENAGSSLQQAIEAIVEQTVERMTAEGVTERAAGKGEGS